MYDREIICDASIEVKGGYYTKKLRLPIEPYPGLCVGALKIKEVSVCQGGDSHRGIDITMEPSPSITAELIEFWGGWEFNSDN